MQQVFTLEKILIVFSICLIVFHAFDHTHSEVPIKEAIGSGVKQNEENVTENIPRKPKLPVVAPTLTADDLVYNTSRNTVPMVNEEFKVVFFQVAKAASSEWIRFFSRLSGSPQWCQKNIHHHETNGVKYLSDYSLEDAQRMMTDPEWTRAIFVRNPKTRLLSAFLDKAVEHSKLFATKYCKSFERNGGDFDDCVENHENFDFFLHEITVKSWENVHWRPIYTRIDDKWWPYINYVANMENLSDDASHFLQSIHSTKDGVSAWDRIGKSGWSDNERDCNTMGDKSFLAKKDKKHQTNAGDKLRSYYTPELEEFVEKHYERDYNNEYFHFSPLKLYPENR